MAMKFETDAVLVTTVAELKSQKSTVCKEKEKTRKEEKYNQPFHINFPKQTNEHTPTFTKPEKRNEKKAYRLYVVSFAYFYARTLEKVLAQQLYDSGSKFFFLFTAFFFLLSVFLFFLLFFLFSSDFLRFERVLLFMREQSHLHFNLSFITALL